MICITNKQESALKNRIIVLELQLNNTGTFGKYSKFKSHFQDEYHTSLLDKLKYFSA